MDGFWFAPRPEIHSRIHVPAAVQVFLSLLQPSVLFCRRRNACLLMVASLFFSADGTFRTTYCSNQEPFVSRCLCVPAARTPTTSPLKNGHTIGLEQRPVDRSVVPPMASGIARRKKRCSTEGDDCTCILGRARTFKHAVLVPGTFWTGAPYRSFGRDYSHKCGLGRLRAAWASSREVAGISSPIRADYSCFHGMRALAGGEKPTSLWQPRGPSTS